MKVAYLILTHTHPKLLARMVNALDAEFATFFIHVDREVDLQPFSDSIKRSPRVVFLNERAKVFWMGYSLVEATLNLMRGALAHSNSSTERFKYYVLLSGTDYPIKSNEYIYNFFQTTTPTEYMLYWKIADYPAWRHKIERYHYLDCYLTNRRSGFLYSRVLYELGHRILHRLIPKRKYLEELTAYGGSAWWMLTEAAVEFILDYIEQNSAFVQFYRFSHAPDEMVFHTIMLNSPFQDRLNNRSAYEQLIPLGRYDAETEMLIAHSFNLRYIDWDPAREFPAILDERDYNALERSRCLFARKMDPLRSKTLLDLVDQNIRRMA